MRNSVIRIVLILVLISAFACTGNQNQETTATREDGTTTSRKSNSGDKDVIIAANANILTMNASQPTASAIAVKDGKILAIGDLAAVKNAVGNSYEYYDLEGKTVVPGLSRATTTWCNTAPFLNSWISPPLVVPP